MKPISKELSVTMAVLPLAASAFATNTNAPDSHAAHVTMDSVDAKNSLDRQSCLVIFLTSIFSIADHVFKMTLMRS